MALPVLLVCCLCPTNIGLHNACDTVLPCIYSASCSIILLYILVNYTIMQYYSPIIQASLPWEFTAKQHRLRYLVDGVVGVEVGPETLSVVGVIPSTVALLSAVVHNGNALVIHNTREVNKER